MVQQRQIQNYPGQSPQTLPNVPPASKPTMQLNQAQVAVPPTPMPACPAPPPPPCQQAPVQQTTSTTTPSRLKMLLRLGDGKPRFEIRSSDSTELLLKVYGEKVEMQAAPESMKSHPIAGVTARGPGSLRRPWRRGNLRPIVRFIGHRRGIAEGERFPEVQARKELE